MRMISLTMQSLISNFFHSAEGIITLKLKQTFS